MNKRMNELVVLFNCYVIEYYISDNFLVLDSEYDCFYCELVELEIVYLD